jgi:hypothetical protein
MSEKKLAERLRLTDNNPTAVKLQKLFALADELGISLAYGQQTVRVFDNDRDSKLPTLFMEDIEDHHWFEEFPPTTEYKLVYDNPLFIEQRRKEYEERDRKREEEARLEREKRAAREKADVEKRAREQEARERKLLSDLKSKYEG